MRRVSVYLSMVVVALAALIAWYGPIPLTLAAHDPDAVAVARQNRERKIRAVRAMEWDYLTTGATAALAAGMGYGLFSLGLGLVNRRSKRHDEQRRRGFYEQ